MLETESERLIKIGVSQGISRGIKRGMSEGINRGKAQMLIEMSREAGLDDTAILKRLQDKISLTLEQAMEYLSAYGK